MCIYHPYTNGSSQPPCAILSAYLASRARPHSWQRFVQGVQNLHHKAPAVAQGISQPVCHVEHGAKAVDVLEADACGHRAVIVTTTTGKYHLSKATINPPDVSHDVTQQ
jgi:hypothetical protein